MAPSCFNNYYKIERNVRANIKAQANISGFFSSSIKVKSPSSNSQVIQNVKRVLTHLSQQHQEPARWPNTTDNKIHNMLLDKKITSGSTDVYYRVIAQVLAFPYLSTLLCRSKSFTLWGFVMCVTIPNLTEIS